MIDPAAERRTHDYVRVLAAPCDDDSAAAATRAVLVSWAHANGLPHDRMLARDPIEIRNSPDGPGQLIHYRECQLTPPTTHGRDCQTVARTKPLLIEPVGLLNAELGCGHVAILHNPAAAHVCDQDIDPVTGRHPGPHSGGPAEHPITGARAEWPNEHPGDLPFRGGLPYAGDMAPAAAHAVSLACLNQLLDIRPRPRRETPLLTHTHAHGLRKIAVRHAPRRYSAPAAGGPLCERRCSAWPCPDYRDALAGIVAFAPAAGR